MIQRNRLIPVLFGNTTKYFDFNLAQTTFTPKMAKRATSVFAAAPIVQGKSDTSGNGDIISYPLGTTIANNFYANYDVYQGSIIFWVTPEWNGNDGLTHLLVTFQNSGVAAVIKLPDNRLYFDFGWGSAVSTSISTWAAGTTYCVVCRWDRKNTLDGTNYLGISVNDTHTFGSTSFTQNIYVDNRNVGSSSTGQYPANAVIQGLTIYRRPLFDGTYGVDVGNGDEINLIYNSGTGQDPTLITGSWDVVFCLPTNATAGELATGTGEAWTHPHASNALTRGWLNDRYYGGGAWGVRYNGTTTLVDCGSDASLDDLPTGNFTYEGWVRPNVLTARMGLASKRQAENGWYAYLENNGNFIVSIKFAGGTISVNQPSGITVGSWAHVAFTYTLADGCLRTYINGRLMGTSSASSGAYVGDAAYSLYLGAYAEPTHFLNGSMGWIRISNSIRYSSSFIPPRSLPAPDANTVEQWAMNEGTGATAAATVNVANNGTITNGTWEPQWISEGTEIVPYSVEFNGTTTSINCGSNASIDDLADNAFTAEGWFNADTAGEGSGGRLLGKRSGSEGWLLYLSATGINGLVACATTQAIVAYSTAIVSDKKFHHIAMTWDDAGDRKIRLFLDGILVGTSSAGVGAIVTDSAIDLYIGSNSAGDRIFDGRIGWARISNSIRYTANFIPPSRLNPPATDANTMAQYNFRDGAGTTLTDATGVNNGTISNGTWNITPDMATDSPGARVFNWGYVVGNDAANEGVKQTLTGLTAGANYVVRALGYSEEGRGQPKIIAYDETNGAEISHLDGDWSRERVANGTFGSDTLWTKGTGWSIAAGVAHCDGTQVAISNLYQVSGDQLNGGIVAGRLYKLTFTISNYSAGTIMPYIGSSSPGSSRSANGTYSEIIRCVAPLNIVLAADADFIGDIDNVSVTPVSEESKPDPLLFSFELPTIARNGVAADCTSVSIKLVNAATEGVVGWDQVELLTNLIDNPSLDGAVADPFIPYGWIQSGVVAGEVLRETTVTHSSGVSMRCTANQSETYQLNVASVGSFYSAGFFGYQGTGGNVTGTYTTSSYVKQTSLAVTIASQFGGAGWKHYCYITRGVAGGNSQLVDLRHNSYAEATNHYFDDVYAIALTPVSLTVTPASYANSLEGTNGIRVDGYDLLTQTVPAGRLTNTSGIVRCKYTPRHGSADAIKFGNSQASILRVYSDANNAIVIVLNAANQVLITKVQGGVATSTSGVVAFTAGTTYNIEVRYGVAGISLYVNNVLTLTHAGAVALVGNPVGCYWGTNVSNFQGDAVFSNP